MAEQPNISQILAALAAQHPGNAAAQGPPPQQSHPIAYPTSAYPSTTQLPAYALPQPSASGNFDLSHIKPSNSGSVSLADALVKARGIAAEKGVSYDTGRSTVPYDGDQRFNTARGYPSRSRSRSRSPQRTNRDTFRDNYNPYRDERREDARRPTSGFSRERSFSPGLGGRGPVATFPSRPFGQEDRSPAYASGGQPDNVETITIDSALVGLIIGRQGENLRRVEAETSTRVQFITGPETTGPKRQCKITGTRQAREDAKAEIARIIEENGNPARGNVPPDRTGASAKTAGAHQPVLRAGEDSTQIMVPNRTVGLIIGRGGETIRDLQERSQCHVNIVGEEKSVNGLRPVNLIGTPQAAAMAKDLIMEIVDSDTKSMIVPGGGAPAARDGVRGQGGAGLGGFNGGGDSFGDKLNDTLTVPSEAVGMIIGKGGETIKDMQTSTGCKINVAQPSGQDLQREIGLVGSRTAIEAAKRAIMDKVYAVEEKNRSGGGGGGGGGGRRDEHQQSDRYSQPQQQYGQQGGYGQQQPQQQQFAPQGQVLSQGDPDPYAAYGGYQNYIALWYASMAQQGQQPPGQAPPG